MLSADEISANYARVRERIAEACARVGRNPAEVVAVAVTKGHPAKLLASALRAGITKIGENRIQEACRKYEQLGELRERISWHLVGHLQRNKVKDALTIFDIIHSLDSRRLADEIAHRHQLMGLSKPVPCLVQVNTSSEPSKFGCAPEDAEQLVAYAGELPAIEVRGLMTIGLWDADQEKVRPCFVMLRELAEKIAERKVPGVKMEHLSMGMSGDFQTAVEEGATLLRLGTVLFGHREDH